MQRAVILRGILILVYGAFLAASGCRFSGRTTAMQSPITSRQLCRQAAEASARDQGWLAESLAAEAIDLDPRSPAAWAALGRVKRAAGRPKDALADFYRALALSPGDREITWQIADLYRELGRPQRALAALDSLAATYTAGDEPGRLFYWQGVAQKTLGRYDDAVESFTKAIVREPPTAEVLSRLAEAQMLAGRPDRAAASAREALALDPRHQPSLDLLGRCELALRPAVTAMQ